MPKKFNKIKLKNLKSKILNLFQEEVVVSTQVIGHQVNKNLSKVSILLIITERKI